jgi:hypothetical protein
MKSRTQAGILTLRILSVLIMAALVTLTGLHTNPKTGLSTSWGIVSVAVLAVAFAGSLTFRQSKVWSLGLFLLGAYMLGLIFPWLGLGRGDGGDQVRMAGVLVGASLFVSFGIGRILRPGFLMLRPFLWALTLIYWVGWAVLGLLGLSAIERVFWAGSGYILFTGLTASWAAGLSPAALEHGYVQKSIEIYTLAINLLLSALGMLRPI